MGTGISFARFVTLGLLFALPVITVTLPGCGEPPRAERIVLVTLDTVRADHLGCYGYEQGATPNLDQLAREGVLFEQALSPVPVTLPSHSSMFTGLYPPQHGVHYNGTFKLEPSFRTMAEILEEHGYATGAVPASFAVAKRFGLDQGFDEYEDLFAEKRDNKEELPANAERKAEDVAARGVAWLDRHRSGPAFLWLHFYDPHSKYEPPFPFSNEFRDRPYDGEIAFVDRELGEVMAKLRADGEAWARTLLIVAGDHGEGLYDHGESMHGALAYQSTLHVPLIIKAPGAEGGGRRFAEPVSLVDLLPTVLDYAGLPPEKGLPGLSLKGALENGRLEPRGLFFEALTGALNYGWSSLEGVRRGRWKLIAGVDPELYDLAADSGETRSLQANERSRAQEMQQEVDEWLAAWKAESKSPSEAPPADAEALERLASVGYIGVGGSEAEREGADPKTLVHLEREMLGAITAVNEGRWDDVASALEYVLEHDPVNRLALFYLARARLETGRKDEARRLAEQLAHRYTDFAQGHDILGLAWKALDRPDKAVEAYRAGVELVPDSSLLRFRLSLALFEAGEVASACNEVKTGLLSWPEWPDLLMLRARCEAVSGRLDDAVATLGEVLRHGLDPRRIVEQERDFSKLRALPAYRDLLVSMKKGGVVQKND